MQILCMQSKMASDLFYVTFSLMDTSGQMGSGGRQQHVYLELSSLPQLWGV